MSKNFTVYVTISDDIEDINDVMNYLAEYGCFEFSEDNARRAAKMNMRDDCSDACAIIPLEVKISDAMRLSTTITESPLDLD